jgi:predicted RNA-binding Zn ribbon-like protein
MNKLERGGGRSPQFPRLLGGRLCLDFANTVEGPMDPEPEDFLHDYGDLARWSWHAGAIDDDELERLSQRGEVDPAVAADVFAEAVQLRTAVETVFRAVAAGEGLPQRQLRTVQRCYAEAIAAARLAADDRRVLWTWRGLDDLYLPLWLVAASALELLNGGDLGRVRRCPGADDCGWLFYDASRSGTRRWCSMEGCGSRVKMRRQYARKRRGR